MSRVITLGNKQISDHNPSYFIADISANHDGDIERAKDLIFSCAEAGADAAKFQNFNAETIVSDYGFKSHSSNSSHQGMWKKSVFEVYKDASLPLDWTQELFETCQKAGVDYMTTPYALDILDHLSNFVAAWKLGSGDITWHDEIEHLARDNKPLLIATGASNIHEVDMAMDVALQHTHDIVLMQCNTNYTGDLENFKHVALNVLKTYARKYPATVLGLSDHTPGHATVLGAVALGARVIEKHYTDDTSREGPDHGFSMDPKAWKEMVQRTRELEYALGPEEKYVMPNEAETVVVQRRAIRSTRELKVGDTLSSQDLCVLRPCPKDALPPYAIHDLIGKTLVTDIPAGEIVQTKDVK